MMASNALHLATGAVVTWLGRALYLATVIAVAVAAWLVLGVIASPFVRPHLRSNAGVVMVTSAIRGDTLPLRYAKRIESIPGTRHVLFSDYSVVSCNDTAPAVSINARGGSGAQAEILGEAAGKSASDNALRKKWQSDPLGVLVGTRVASTCGWKAGMIVSPRDYFSGSPIELHIIGLLKPQKNPIANGIGIAHYKYINRTTHGGAGQGRVADIEAYPADPRAAPQLAARIELAFAHDSPPVNAMIPTESQNGLTRYGEAQYVLGCVMFAILLCTALVLVTVLSHEVTQRRAQMAILQVLGFSRVTLFGSFVLETLFIVLPGAILGIGIGLFTLQLLPAALGRFFNEFVIPGWTWWGLPSWLSVLLVVSLLVPAFVIARLRPVDVRAL